MKGSRIKQRSAEIIFHPISGQIYVIFPLEVNERERLIRKPWTNITAATTKHELVHTMGRQKFRVISPQFILNTVNQISRLIFKD